MQEYNVCTIADEDIFRRQCKAIEKNIKPLKKEELLTDVDGTLIQKYYYGDSVIIVFCDVEADGVYVKSDIELKTFFRKAV